MGKGEANRLPPVPGGVIWWDQDGVQKHTPYPPASPMKGPILLFVFGGLFAFQCVAIFIMAAVLGGTGVVIAGVVFLVLSALLLGGGYKCYQGKKDIVITLFYPNSGAVEYLKGNKTLYHPPPGYTPPPGFNRPQPGAPYQAPGSFPVTTQQGAAPYNPTAPLMPPQGGQPYHPGAGAPPPNQQPYYNPTAPPPPEGVGHTYPGYGPPPQGTGRQERADLPPPAYDEVVNKV